MSTALGIRRMVDMWKPFSVDVQPFIDEITTKEKMIRECADVGTIFMQQFEVDITANPEDIREYLKQEIAADTDEDAMDEELQEQIVAGVVGRSKGM